MPIYKWAKLVFSIKTRFYHPLVTNCILFMFRGFGWKSKRLVVISLVVLPWYSFLL